MWTDGWIGPPTSSTSSPDPAAARRNGQPSHRQQQADRPARSAPHRRRLPPPKPAPISTVLMSNLRIAGWVQQDPARGIRLHRSRGASWPVHYMTAQGPHGPASGQRWSQRGPCRPRAQMGSGMAVCGGGNRPGRQQRNARPSSAASAENRSARTLAAALTSLKTAAMGEGRDRDDTRRCGAPPRQGRYAEGAPVEDLPLDRKARLLVAVGSPGRRARRRLRGRPTPMVPLAARQSGTIVGCPRGPRS